ncbi:hypothetical protein SCUCBS95973_002865 [Sporothrix curviconia]|uniref:Caib baif family enzyme n=1 Tax=Sporothrix curviconia TaxID=1260050 RepID=A0ABP0BAK6_9PEZI
MAEPDFTILTPNAMLGYGYRADHFWHGIEHYRPAAIIVDSGSTDAGPYKLGMNKMTCSREAYLRDLGPMLEACFHFGVKVLIGSAGGDGSNAHVAEMLSFVEEIARDKGYSFKVATITNDLSRALIHQRLAGGHCSPCGPVADLTAGDVDDAVTIVAQMGAEPFQAALRGDPDIVLGGRAYDPAAFAAFCLNRGVAPGVAWHMGKIMECGGICAVPKGRSMVARMQRDAFELTPLSPLEKCTPVSVAAHTLYEKTRPDRLPGPGGVLHLDTASYEQCADGRTVRVAGARFVPTPVYQVKLEGVARLGHRTIFIGGVRDPILIAQIDAFLEAVRTYIQKLFPALDQSDNCRLIYHVYGRNGVMGPLEPTAHDADAALPHELGILGEVVAPTQALSYAIANNVRTSLLHFPYEGQLATTGNFASPLSPQEQDAGAVFRFSVYHLVDLQPGEETSLFPVTVHHLQNNNNNGPQDKDTSSRLTDAQRTAFATDKPADIPETPVSPGPVRMRDIANVVRSKNSGPFELTLDIMFSSAAKFERVRRADVLTNDVIQRLYGVAASDILVNMYFEPALAWKCTIKRPWAQGSIGERDTLGTQQHAPLLSVLVPAEDSTEAAT